MPAAGYDRIAGRGGASFGRRLLELLRRRLGPDPPSLRLVLWDGDAVTFVPEPRVTITLGSRSLVRRLLTGDIAGLGDAYARGELAVDGEVWDVLAVGMEIAERLGRSARLGTLLKPLKFLASRHSRRADAAAIGYHYDVSNQFYQLWLDREMVYSCAYFRSGAEDIDTAQRQKLDHICRKLRLAPGERLLDVGCGWGALVRWAAARHGVRAVGITLSERQLEHARARIAAEGLSDQVEVRLQDYRDVPGTACFDKIVSVGMYEHVGIANLPRYFARLQSLLKPGGVLLNHGIVTTDPDGRAKGPPGGEFIGRHVFPGGELPHLSEALRQVARSGLEPIDVEDLRPHYAMTLRHWVGRLEAARDAAVGAAGPERYRIWRIYLAGMAVAFERGWLSVAQVLALKPAAGRPAERPWTRDYQYASVVESAATAPPKRDV